MTVICKHNNEATKCEKCLNEKYDFTADKLMTKDNVPEYEYAKRLAHHLWKRFYKTDAPEWEPCDDLMGVLTQIDNMTTGLYTHQQARELVIAEILACKDLVICGRYNAVIETTEEILEKLK